MGLPFDVCRTWRAVVDLLGVQKLAEVGRVDLLGVHKLNRPADRSQERAAARHWSHGAEHCAEAADPAPEILQCCARTIAPTVHQAVRE